MARNIIVYFMTCWCFIPAVYAVDVGEVSTFIHSSQDNIFKEIANPTDNARLILISVEKISSPAVGGEVVPMNRDELMLTPSRLLLPANARNNVRFFYNGPSDDVERYYRINWTDMALSEEQLSTSTKKATAVATALISTILVVSPRVERFSYEFKDGKLLNTGNVSYRVIAYGTCKKEKEVNNQCKENYNDLPGKVRDFKSVDIDDKESFLSIWHGDSFITVK